MVSTATNPFRCTIMFIRSLCTEMSRKGSIGCRVLGVPSDDKVVGLQKIIGRCAFLVKH
jgi:hypothetical protein